MGQMVKPLRNLIKVIKLSPENNTKLLRARCENSGLAVNFIIVSHRVQSLKKIYFTMTYFITNGNEHCTYF